ncbi:MULTISPECIES: SLC13 family permease [unclassified Curtobacterium]|uniref:SLC13 family permease n=1 Tax=unclassified Curtobacterium TaxID=257496 RepID=UPI00052AB70B|nr:MULTISPECIES: SLC13 family permease [unclassified Curtobacterium]AIV40425.1 arsenic transporter [Curtobacterium sp. MR_MD2014]MBP1302472.1 Na+/H+ antiporter NhaD/arsenite permease-like protein [Curtobacterium sp. 1310]MCM3506309.1 SLC13 family permease [Curtobacterium sp. ODYSSEY 48 V2]MDP9735493.1 Na+/H+ antiporter NhaD/arsenite permease-like protein [Curtobacterium sp. 260]MDT0211785.1 ArsB/NhaD family transporter [Curtobacterium sp. BRD11]
MRQAVIGGVLLVVGAVCVALGLLPLSDLGALADRVVPVLAFVLGLTIVSELAADAGVFDRLADLAARVGGGRTIGLWAAVVVLAVVCTVFLSIDTTAVLLTPIVITLARRVGLPPMPFALTTVWLANTASLLLPVSNLTNLLAVDGIGLDGPIPFAGLMVWAALAGVVVPCAVLLVVFRGKLFGRYTPVDVRRPRDPLFFWAASVVLVLLVVALTAGVTVWVAALVAAALLVVVAAFRAPSELRPSRVPWATLVFAAGLFVVVETLHATGLTDPIVQALSGGTDTGSLLLLGGAGGVAANAIDNLPAYLVLEPAAGHEALRYAALLVGVNAGCLITPWASLATLLWHARLSAEGVHLSWGRYMALGCVVAPLTVVAGVLALQL